MRIRVYSKGKFYLIECPEGARVVRCPTQSYPDSRSASASGYFGLRGSGHVVRLPQIGPNHNRPVRSFDADTPAARRETGW
jgi:hypothetical protein